MLSYVSFEDCTAESKNYLYNQFGNVRQHNGFQEQATEIYNVEYIRLKSICKMEGHPTVQGMKQISEQVLLYLEDYAQSDESA